MKLYECIVRRLSLTIASKGKNNVKARMTSSLVAVILLAISSACESFVDIGPPKTEVVSETVYNSDATAVAAIRGIYIEMVTGGFTNGSLSSVTNVTGLSADETTDFTQSPDRLEFNVNSLTANNGIIKSLWNEAYRLVYYANSILEGLVNSTGGVTEATKMQLEGEARFVRAFLHFYLVNLFGDIPIMTSTNFMINNLAPRSPSMEVYLQIITDLKEAQSLLKDDYSFSLRERVHPNRWAATALLARAFLYSGDWSRSEDEATKVINTTSLYMLESDLSDVFLANSSEAIWQLKPVSPGKNTLEAQIFINESLPNFQVLRPELVNAFEPYDSRKSNWLDSIISDGVIYYHPFKYKIKKPNEPLTEYSTVLRLAELYLIRAEARTQRGNIAGAQADLNVIRNRAGLGNTPANDKTSLLLAIEKERRLELFTEWGHRWLDLIRAHRTGAVLSPIALKDWQSTDVLYPIPQAEMELNPRLTQNEGY